MICAWAASLCIATWANENQRHNDTWLPGPRRTWSRRAVEAASSSRLLASSHSGAEHSSKGISDPQLWSQMRPLLSSRAFEAQMSQQLLDRRKGAGPPPTNYAGLWRRPRPLKLPVRSLLAMLHGRQARMRQGLASGAMPAWRFHDRRRRHLLCGSTQRMHRHSPSNKCPTPADGKRAGREVNFQHSVCPASSTLRPRAAPQPLQGSGTKNPQCEDVPTCSQYFFFERRPNSSNLCPCAPRSSTPNWLARVRSYQVSGLGRQFPPPSRQSCPIHRFARLYWACARERAGAPGPVSLLPHGQGDERDDLLPRTHAPCLSSSVVKAMLDEACCSSTLEPP